MAARRRRLPIGAEVVRDGVSFRIWAPGHKKVEVVLEGGDCCGAVHKLTAEEEGYFSGTCREARAGSLYRFGWGYDGEKLEFGGSGTPKLDTEKFWRLQGNAAVVLIPVPEGDAR